MRPTYSITEVLNLIAGATAVELMVLIQVVDEEYKLYSIHQLQVIRDEVTARRQILQAAAGR